MEILGQFSAEIYKQNPNSGGDPPVSRKGADRVMNLKGRNPDIGKSV